MPRSWVYFMAPASVGAALMATSLVEAWLIWQRKAPISLEIRTKAFMNPRWAVVTTSAALLATGVLLGHLVRGEDYALAAQP